MRKRTKKALGPVEEIVQSIIPNYLFCWLASLKPSSTSSATFSWEVSSVVVPGNVGDMSGMVASAMAIYKNVNQGQAHNVAAKASLKPSSTSSATFSWEVSSTSAFTSWSTSDALSEVL